MVNAFPEVVVWQTKDERIALLPDGRFTEGYSSVEEFSGHPGFRKVWEYKGTPATNDKSWERLECLNSSEANREEFKEEAFALEQLWAFCLRIQGKGWKLSAWHGRQPIELIPGAGNSGSGRDAGTSQYTPDCSTQEAIKEIDSWLECQDNVDRLVAMVQGRGGGFLMTMNAQPTQPQPTLSEADDYFAQYMEWAEAQNAIIELQEKARYAPTDEDIAVVEEL